MDGLNTTTIHSFIVVFLRTIPFQIIQCYLKIRIVLFISDIFNIVKYHIFLKCISLHPTVKPQSCEHLGSRAKVFIFRVFAFKRSFNNVKDINGTGKKCSHHISRLFTIRCFTV